MTTPAKFKYLYHVVNRKFIKTKTTAINQKAPDTINQASAIGSNSFLKYQKKYQNHPKYAAI